MKKRNTKGSKLSRFEKRVEERHKKQEAEYGRDEFLFGEAEDDEEVDVEYETESWDAADVTIPDTTDADRVPEDDWDMAETAGMEDEPPQNPVGVGETTEMISADIVEAKMASLAVEMEASGDGYIESETNDADRDLDDYIANETDDDLPDDEIAVEDEDFDFYDMSATAELEALAVAEKIYGHRSDGADKAADKSRKTSAKKAGAYAGSTKKSARSARSRKSKKRKAGFLGGLAGFFANMSMSDRILVATGVCVLAVAVFAGTMFVNAQTLKKQIDEFKSVGTSSDGIYIVGEDGINAVVAARSNYIGEPDETEEIIEEQVEEPEIVSEDKSVTIVMKVSSVQSDLKIKFVNQATDKLITGIPFAVIVTEAGGKEYNWADENKDGLMYHTEVPNGTYKVVMKPLEGPEYEDYIMPSEVSGVKVTDTIAYKKVDVADEVKTEAEVNVAVEDTAVQDTAVESSLTDTVEWVESTKTLISGSEEGYTAIDKSSIPDPNKTSSLGNIKSYTVGLRASSSVWMMPYMGSSSEPSAEAESSASEEISISVSPGSLSLNAGETGTVSASISGTDNTGVEWSSDNPSVATVSPGGTVTAVSAGNATITAKSSANPDKSAACTVTVTASDSGNTGGDPEPSTEPAQATVSSVSISASTLSITKGNTGSLSAAVKMSDGSDGGSVSWTSSNTDVASVSGGTVTGVSAGTAVITAKSDSDSSKYASCTVTVTDNTPSATPKLTLSASSVSVKAGATSSVTANVSGTSDTKVNWSSSDTSVAMVDNGTIKGIKAGTATITATLNVDSGIAATVSVTVSDSIDPKAALKDSSGREVYIKKSDGSYVAATVADYATASAFYIKGGAGDAVYKYTGWQTIDGATYYFTKDGNYVTGEQVIQGAKYNFDSNGHLSASSGTMGIDVSKWNGSIDWNAVKNSGVSYVIIRCGYRGSTTGALIEDPKFRSNISGAKAAGLAVGAYFFTQAVSEVEAVEEASMAVGLCSGYGLSLPIFLDVEHSGGRGDRIDSGTRTAVCKAFCQTVRNSGFGAGVYANKTWFTSYINASQLTGYKIWLAQYAASPTYTATRYDYWQYSSKGSVAGISGNVDLNLRY